MVRQGLVVWTCGLVMAAGCGPVTEVEATASSPAEASAQGPGDSEGFARGLVEALGARDKDAFMALVISVEAMREIIEATTSPADAKARMIAEAPAMITPRRAEHAEGFDQLVFEGDAQGVRWDEASFVGVEVIGERTDSGTVARELAIRFDAGGTVYTLTARQCISHVGGSVYLLGKLRGPISEAAARVEAVRETVKVVHSVATAYFAEKGEFPADVTTLAKEGLGDISVIDAWETELSMWSRGEEVQICSAGPDTTHGTYDDVCWPK